MIWLQGWDQAPKVAIAARTSWVGRNPGWKVQALDQSSLGDFLPAGSVDRIFAIPKPYEAISDQIRLELLHRYGGVWADSTTICTCPLDTWLSDHMPTGFFAFSKPGRDRMISTWFLAAEKGSLIIERWRAAAWAYWENRTQQDSYFWVHHLFETVYLRDLGFRTLWDATPVISAIHPYHFSPDAPALMLPADASIAFQPFSPVTPVMKLTHKFSIQPGPESLFSRLCSFGMDVETPLPRTTPVIRILVGWYGSFAGHGTIGDLRSLEALVSHLVGCGFDVLHATAKELTIVGARRVDWASVPPEAADVVIFVCGPIIPQHPQTSAFFSRFANCTLAGLGVSLMPDRQGGQYNPFDTVFARQGGAGAFGDVAITSPSADPQPAIAADLDRPQPETVIGLSLRGMQHEYGTADCFATEAQALFEALIDHLAKHGPVRVVPLENHLGRSGQEPDDIERGYGQCNLVLTTRYHGAITALRQNVPFIAVDQIRGGAKVWPLLQNLGWQGVFRIDAVSAVDIVRLGQSFLAADQDIPLSRTQSSAVREANRTLGAVADWLRGLRSCNSATKDRTGPHG